jgi:dolichol-phosphate mannosyltransferase
VTEKLSVKASGPLETVEPLPFPLEARELSPTVAVVIPVFNEEDVLALTYERVAETLDSFEVAWSITFVNDGSSDGTHRLLERLFGADPRVSYVVLSRNFGHQAALAAGLDFAEGDVVITMDADLQHPPELIGSMLDAWRAGFDVVHTRKLETEALPPVRAFLTRIAYRLIRGVASVPILEQASDFRLLDREAVDAIRRLPERGRLYRGLTPWVGFRQAVLPFVADARQGGSSQYSYRQLLSLFSRSFFDFSRAPLQLALFVGGAAIVVCLGYLGYVLVALAIGEYVPRGFTSLILTFVFLSSVNLFFAGILGVYVARIYDEVRGRPTYVVGRVRSRRTESDRHEVERRAFDDELQPLSHRTRA